MQRKLYSLPAIEAVLADTALTDDELRKKLHRKVSELRHELRQCGFEVPMKYLNRNVDKVKVAKLRAKGMTLQEIGDIVGVSGERVRQILDKIK